MNEIHFEDPILASAAFILETEVLPHLGGNNLVNDFANRLSQLILAGGENHENLVHIFLTGSEWQQLLLIQVSIAKLNLTTGTEYEKITLAKQILARTIEKLTPTRLESLISKLPTQELLGLLARILDSSINQAIKVGNTTYTLTGLRDLFSDSGTRDDAELRTAVEISGNRAFRRFLAQSNIARGVSIFALVIILNFFATEGIVGTAQGNSESEEDDAEQLPPFDIYTEMGVNPAEVDEYIANNFSGDRLPFLYPRIPNVDWHTELASTNNVEIPVSTTVGMDQLPPIAVEGAAPLQEFNGEVESVYVYVNGNRTLLTREMILQQMAAGGGFSHVVSTSATYTSQNPFGSENHTLYSESMGHLHWGSDWAGRQGDPVFLGAGATVLAAGPGYTSDLTPDDGVGKGGGLGGNAVILGIPTGWRDASGEEYIIIEVYGHLSSRADYLVPGALVPAGAQIGEIGHAGNAAGDHLHYELWVAKRNNFQVETHAGGMTSFHISPEGAYALDAQEFLFQNLDGFRIGGDENSLAASTREVSIPVYNLPQVLPLDARDKSGFITWTSAVGPREAIQQLQLIYSGRNREAGSFETPYFINETNFPTIAQFVANYMDLSPGTGTEKDVYEALLWAEFIFAGGNTDPHATTNPYLHELRLIALGLTDIGEDAHLKDVLANYEYLQDARLQEDFVVTESTVNNLAVSTDELKPFKYASVSISDSIRQERAPQTMLDYFSTSTMGEGNLMQTLQAYQNLVNLILLEPPRTFDEYSLNLVASVEAFELFRLNFPEGIQNLSSDPLIRSRQLYLLNVIEFGFTNQNTTPDQEGNLPQNPLAELLLNWRAEGETALNWEEAYAQIDFEYIAEISDGSWITQAELQELYASWGPDVSPTNWVLSLEGSVGSTEATEDYFVALYNDMFNYLNSPELGNPYLPRIINNDTLLVDGVITPITRQQALEFTATRLEVILRTLKLGRTIGIDNQANLPNQTPILQVTNPYVVNWRAYFYYQFYNNGGLQPQSALDIWQKFTGLDPEFSNTDLPSLIRNFDHQAIAFAPQALSYDSYLAGLASNAGLILQSGESTEAIGDGEGQEAETQEQRSLYAQFTYIATNALSEMRPQESVAGYLDRMGTVYNLGSESAFAENSNEWRLILYLNTHEQAKNALLSYLGSATESRQPIDPIFAPMGADIHLTAPATISGEIKEQGEAFTEGSILALVYTSGSQSVDVNLGNAMPAADPMQQWVASALSRAEADNSDGYTPATVFGELLNHLNGTLAQDPAGLFNTAISAPSSLNAEYTYQLNLRGWSIGQTFLDYYQGNAELSQRIHPQRAEVINAYLIFTETGSSANWDGVSLPTPQQIAARNQNFIEGLRISEQVFANIDVNGAVAPTGSFTLSYLQRLFAEGSTDGYQRFFRTFGTLDTVGNINQAGEQQLDYFMPGLRIGDNLLTWRSRTPDFQYQVGSRQYSFNNLFDERAANDLFIYAIGQAEVHAIAMIDSGTATPEQLANLDQIYIQELNNAAYKVLVVNTVLLPPEDSIFYELDGGRSIYQDEYYNLGSNYGSFYVNVELFRFLEDPNFAHLGNTILERFTNLYFPAPMGSGETNEEG